MYVDPVVEEIRRNAAQIAKECEGDIHKLAERFRREQTANVHRLVRRSRTKVENKKRPQR
jgi:hypothetical protein